MVLCGNWCADTMFNGCKSLYRNICARVFTRGKVIYLEPTTSKSEVGLALQLFAQEVSVPERLIFDGALHLYTSISNLTARGDNQCTAWEEEVTSNASDISEWYLDFEFYEWVLY